MSGGELFEKLADPNYKMTEPEAKRYIRQICEGLQHMHEANIVHLDIKPENILFETKSSPNVKLVDFGLATKLDPDEVVKVSSATVEFAAPEIVEQDSVGFATDMWAVGVLTYVILSGLSPFGGVDDAETSENIKKCDPKFPSDGFTGISENGLDFIKKLLVKNKMSRMNVFEALDHPWLAEEDTTDGAQIPSGKYDAIRARIKDKYSAWPAPNPALGRSANFSSLRKHRPKEYSIYSTYFDRRDANPRFVRKPRNQNVIEGQTATFSCIILAVSPPVVTWYQGGNEIKQSVKYFKKYNRNSYALEVKRCTLDDKGEFICRAVNSYGEREYNVFLNVERKFNYLTSMISIALILNISYSFGERKSSSGRRERGSPEESYSRHAIRFVERTGRQGYDNFQATSKIDSSWHWCQAIVLYSWQAHAHYSMVQRIQRDQRGRRTLLNGV